MVYRYQLTYNEIINIIDVKYIPTSTTNKTLSPCMYEIIYINFIIKSWLPKVVKLNITIDDVR